MPLAADNPNGGGGGFTVWIMVAVIFLAFYFVLIRPQQKRRKQVESMQSTMGPGDEVITIGGLYGTVRSLDGDSVLLEIAPEIVVRYAKQAISRVVTSAADAEAAAEAELADVELAETDAVEDASEESDDRTPVTGKPTTTEAPVALDKSSATSNKVDPAGSA